jgi:nicotinate dehydrogenase subunit B
MPARSVAAVLAAHPTIGDWFDLAPDGHLTAYSGKVEYGQGIRTALAQIVAHELGLPMDAVTVAPVDTRRSPDEGVTSGSRSIEESNEGLRVAAAELRHALRLAAARDLDVVLDEVQLVDGALTTSAGARIEIGRYAGSDLFSHPIDGSVRLRPVASGSVIGSSVPRSDLPAKVLGRPAFLQDIDLPHMLHGRVVRPPGVNARLVSVDEDALSGMPGGILNIVRDGSFLGVVAEREEVAIRGLARLRRVSRWEDGDPLPSSPAFMLDEPTLDVVVHQRGSDSPSDRPTTRSTCGRTWPMPRWARHARSPRSTGPDTRSGPTARASITSARSSPRPCAPGQS